MKIDLFSVPIWISNIDTSKINLEYDLLEKTWLSETESSYKSKNKISQESVDYLFKIIISILDETILRPYNLELRKIWENVYKSNDFQESHIHSGSDLSFVIYKKVINSNTIFINPNRFLVQSFYNDPIKRKLFANDEIFQPKCRENQIVIFPSYLEHFVKKHDNSTTISGNLNIVFED
jgi:hypothetical protein